MLAHRRPGSPYLFIEKQLTVWRLSTRKQVNAAFSGCDRANLLVPAVEPPTPRDRCSCQTQEWYSGTSFDRHEEDDLRKGIVLAIGGLALLAGCGNRQDKASNVPVTPKWKGAPYHIAFDTQAAKPSPVGVTIPDIKYTANPDALERRATLVVRFDASSVTKNGPAMNQMVMAPVDISGAEGALPADYMAAAEKELSKFLGAYCVKGKIKISVLIAKSSLTNQAGDAELDEKRLSDWLPIEVVFKNPHPGC
jgi:hypothetical protein